MTGRFWARFHLVASWVYFASTPFVIAYLWGKMTVPEFVIIFVSLETGGFTHMSAYQAARTERKQEEA